MARSPIARICLVSLLLLAYAAPTARAGGDGASAKGERIEARAMTILRENCTSCHNAEKKKGK